MFDELQGDELEQMFRDLTDSSQLVYQEDSQLYDWDEETNQWKLSKSKFKKWMAQNGWDPGKADKLWDYYKQRFPVVFSVGIQPQVMGSGEANIPTDYWGNYGTWLEPAEGEYTDWSYQGDDDE